MTIPDMAAATAERFGDRRAVVDGDARLTYAELHDAARTFGAALVESGIEPGDRVAIWAPNSAEWIVGLLGVLHAGAAVVPVNTRFKGVEAGDILARSGARALITVTDFLGTDYVHVLRASVDLPELRTIVAARGPASDGTVPWAGFLKRATDAARAEVDRRAAAVTDDDISDILFTSGTTGVPKGVVQTHARTLRVATDWVAMNGLHDSDRYLMVNPYFHMFGLKAGILAAVVAGATMLPEPVFDVDRVLERVGDEQITVLPGPPTLYQSILDHPERGKYELSSLRLAVTGAADIPVELIRRVADELPFRAVITGYGLTEAGTATATSPADDVETIATTVGRPRPGFELRIVDGHGKDVPAGEPGEVLLRGGSVMSHYLDDPEATAHAFSADGWLRTGDLGRVDEAGNLSIVGRAKDMFIVGGFNAYPAEIENILLAHPDIQQAAVIGVPDERLGEVGMAFVVVGQDSTTSDADIISWSRERMANYKAPRRVEIIDELPINATGKVVKDVLRQQAAEHVEGSNTVEQGGTRMAITEERRLRYIDSDGHILEPPRAMLDFSPAGYRDRIWHTEGDADGTEYTVWNGQRTPSTGLAGTAGFTDELVEKVRNGKLTYSQTRPSGWTAALRLQDMDTDGIDVSVLYPTMLLGLQSVRDVEFGRVQARVYNDWCADHLKEGQGRLYGAGALPPMHDAHGVQGVVDEIHHVAELPGMVSVFMRPNPAIEWRYFNDPVYDPIWSALQDCELPVAFHPFLAPDLPGACEGLKLARMRNPDGSYQTLEEYEAAKAAAGEGIFLPNIYFTQAIANPVDVMSAICYITAGGVAERFPGAKFIFLEANGGWLIPWLERLDHHTKKFSWDVPWLKMLPSEYFRRQCWISFDPDESMLAFTANSPLCGADRIIWASDYPHPDAKFPGVTEELEEALAGLRWEQKRAITSESARALYGID